MGLFGAYVVYSVGKRRGERQARQEHHSDRGLCSVCSEVSLNNDVCTYTGDVQDTCTNCCNCPEH